MTDAARNARSPRCGRPGKLLQNHRRHGTSRCGAAGWIQQERPHLGGCEEFAREVCLRMAHDSPQRYVVNMAKRLRTRPAMRSTLPNGGTTHPY